MFSGLSLKSSESTSNGMLHSDPVPSIEGPIGGSGFSFLSGPVNNNEGLSIPSPDRQAEDVASEAPSPSASGFSFLSGVSTSQPQSHEILWEPTPNAVTTGFNFLSGPVSTSEVKTHGTPLEPRPTSVAPIPSSSGFSFLSSSSAAPQPPPMEEPCESTSAFSFLNSSIGSTPTLSSQQQNLNADDQQEGNIAIAPPSSAFSFLNQTVSSNPTSSLSAPPELNINSSQPSNVLADHNGSSQNKNFPSSTIAAGVVFEGAAISKPKPGGIQKKRRGKKIGLGAQEQQDVIAAPEATSNTHISQTKTNEEVSVRSAAELAVERAEQFMLQKQMENAAIDSPSLSRGTSSPPVTVGRYGPPNNNAQATPVVDATVEAAERAAKEAQQFIANGSNNGNASNKAGIMSSFFGRTKKFGFMGNASVHGKGSDAPGPSSGSHSADSYNSNHQANHDLSLEYSETPSTYGNPALNTTPPRNIPISFVPSASVSRSFSNADSARDSDNTKQARDENMDQTAIQRRLEEERRAQFKEQERIWQVAQQEREERERQAREKEEERLRILAEEERRKNRSPEEKMNELLTEFSSEAQHTMKQVSELRIQRALLEEEKVNTEKQLRISTQQRALTERQQTAAAEAEDFYLADRFAAVLENLSKDCQEQESALAGIERALSHLEGQQNELVQQVVGCFQDVRRKLKLLYDEEEGERKEGGSEAQLKFATTAKKISSETERLAIEKEHLERDEELVQKERLELEESIHSETSKDEELRLIAIGELEVTNHEIEALKLQLAQKEAEALKLSMAIAAHDASIVKVRGKFNRQLGRVSKKDLALKENRNEWEADSKALNALRENHEKEAQLHSEKLLKHEQLLIVLKEELGSAERMEAIISSQLNTLNDATIDESLSEVWEQQAGVVECQVAVDEAREELHSALANLDELREEVSQLAKRIPLLEQQKKAAVSARDFKAAGKASKDIKDAISRKEQCEHEISGEATQRITRMTKVLEDIVADLNTKKDEVDKKENEQAQFAMAKLANKISALKEIQKKIADDEEGGIASVGVAVLHEEINCLMKEGETIGEKYGGWLDFIAILKMNGDEGTSASVVPGKSEVIENGDFKTEGTEERADCDQVESTNPDSAKVEITSETIERWQTLMGRIKILEASIESAIAEDDYDAAGDFDDEMQLIKNEIESMSFTEDDIESASKDLAAWENATNDPIAKNEEEQTEDKAALNSELSIEAVQLPTNGGVDVPQLDKDDAAETVEEVELQAAAADEGYCDTDEQDSDEELCSI